MIRARVVGGSVALFLAVWSLIALVLITGHDPALAARKTVTVSSAAGTSTTTAGTSTTATGAATTSSTNSTSSGATSSSTGSGSGTGSAVTSSQS